MKKIILIIPILMMSIISSAQQKKDYNSVVHAIDSLKSSFEDNKYHSSYPSPMSDFWQFDQLSLDDQNKVLDYILKFYDQTEYPKLYDYAGDLLDRFYSRSLDKSVRERIVDIWFENAFCNKNYRVDGFGHTEDWSEKTKKRLCDIMTGLRTKQDTIALKTLSKNYINPDLYIFWQKMAKKIMKQTKRRGIKIENQLVDSMKQQFVDERIRYYKNRSSIDPSFFYQLGYTNDKRFIPIMESLIRKDSLYYEYVCRYPLAKLGVRKYTDEILKNDKEIDYKYLGTEEAFWRYMELNYVWTESIMLNSNDPDVPKPLLITYQVVPNYVKNVPDSLRVWTKYVEDYMTSLPSNMDNYDPTRDTRHEPMIKQINAIYQWLLDHKGHLEFNNN